MAYIRKYPSPPRSRLRSHFSTVALEVRSQELGKKKKSSGTQGNIFHEFEGTQSRVSVNRSDGLNFKKYRIPDRTERLKSSLELHLTNSLLYGAFDKLLGPGSGKIGAVLTPNQC